MKSAIRRQGGAQARATAKRKLTLAQRLKVFDPKLHGGEVMASRPIGVERFWWVRDDAKSGPTRLNRR